MTKKVEGKPFWKSKTLWFNLITIALGVVQVVTEVYPLPVEVLGLVNGVGNVLLRVVTSEPVSLR